MSSSRTAPREAAGKECRVERAGRCSRRPEPARRDVAGQKDAEGLTGKVLRLAALGKGTGITRGDQCQEESRLRAWRLRRHGRR